MKRLLPMLVGAALLTGCRAVPRFHEQPIRIDKLGNTGQIISFDMDKDGRADYWQQLDCSGRKVELRFGARPGEPNERVHPDSITLQEAPHFIIALDGVPYELVEELYRQGRFRLFYPPSRVVTCFPGMTNPAFQRIFGGEKPIAYESKYFDRKRNRMAGGNDTYLSGKAADWAGNLDYRCSFKLDAVSYLKPDMVFKHELREITEVFRKTRKGTRIVYSVATAGLGTRGGREAILEYLRTIDQLCEQIVYERRGRVKISLLADHGHSTSGKGRVSFEKLLEDNGYHSASRLKNPKDVVTVEFGLVTYAAYYTDDPAGVAAALLKDPRIALACYPAASRQNTSDGSNVVVQTSHGRAKVCQRQGRFGYEVEYGDPLELLDIISQLRQGGKVNAEGLIEDRAMFEATLNHTYPDPLRRVWLAFNGLVQQPPDLVVCLKDGWVHGSGLFYSALGKVASTHGSLNQPDSMTFAMTMLGEPPPALRLEEVMPNLKTLERD
jgi:hypothetical protein